ncbi:CaiB/BaiF CoA transferase family protein [Caldinitratiruptor microaerophilus]|uniref:Succinyl-CoA--D-citramalate CoA-transferase n=1 Tax=Caldinitratiruptor microaerophilus TaxID=671077 RepID=A0AA35CJE9_9FIRM|nr:CoA transferase [Caldinitratiruptor microaerophilus]BDG59468.1 succinyl-CoA--D-citramalate CoA-transferase [Caldinitratiruptor microaerophilus]
MSPSNEPFNPAPRGGSLDPARGPLQGIRVVDVTHVIAGPFATGLLADFGAEVIKIEQPGTGDPGRNMGPFAGGESLRFPSLNRNKKGITLDLRHPRGAELFRRLCATADVLVENFRPGTLERWGLGPEVLRQDNPDLIVVRISGYGQTGPDRDKAGFGTPATAFAGLTYILGYPDRPPMNPPIPLADLLAGTFAAMATLLSLYWRDARGGRGQDADISLYESVFRLLEDLPAQYSVTGTIPERRGGSPGGASPAGTYRTADGKWVVLVCSTDSTFNRLAEAIGRPDMITDPRFSTNARRVEHREEVDAIVSDWLGRRTWEEVKRTLDAAGVPVSLVYSIADIFDDPQYRARESIVTVDHPRFGRIAMPGVVPRLSATPGRVVRAAPDPGEHNRMVYRDLLGLTDGELEELERLKVI